MSSKKSGPLRLAFWTGFVRWLGRGAAKLVLAAVILAVAAASAVRFFVTKETLKARMTAALEKTFQRPVEIQGVTLNYLQGIKVSRLVVSEPATPNEVFLSSEFLIVKYRFAALLLGRIELSEVLLMSPRIRLHRPKDGPWNFQSMLAGDKAASGGRFALPPLHSAHRLRIERGRLIVIDEKADRKFGFDAVEFTAKDMRAEGPFEVEFAFDNDNALSGRAISTRWRFEGQADLGGLLPAAMEVSAKRLSLDVDGRVISARGSMKSLAAPEVDLELELPELNSDIVRRYAPNPAAVPDGLALGPSKLELRAGVAAALEAAQGQVSTMTARPVHLRLFKFSADGLRLTASGVLGAAGGKSDLTVSLRGTSLERLSEMYARLKPYGLTGTVDADAKIAGALSAPTVKSASIKLSDFSGLFGKTMRFSKSEIRLGVFDDGKTWTVAIPSGRYSALSNALTDLNVAAKYDGKDLAVDRLSFTWNDSRVDLSGCVEDLRQLSKVRVDAKVDRIKVDELYSTVQNLIALRRAEKGITADPNRGWANGFRLAIPDKYPDLVARLQFAEAVSPNFRSDNFQLVLDLKNISHGLPKVGGNFEVSFGPGRVTDAPKVQAANGLLNVLILPFGFMHSMMSKAEISLKTTVLKTLDINRAFGNFAVQDGVVGVRYIQFDSPQFMAFADGWANFPAETVLLDVLMRATRARGSLPDRLVDTNGRPSLRLAVKDNLNSPTPEISLRKMGKNDIEDALAQGLTRGRPLADLAGKFKCGG